MDINEAAEILRLAFYETPRRQRKLACYLFGIRYADDLGKMTSRQIGEMVEMADVPARFKVEVREGIRLAEYVELDRTNLWFGND